MGRVFLRLDGAGGLGHVDGDVMDHSYKSIHGNFTFAEFYRFVAECCTGSWHGVEVGGLQGQSAACLAVELLNVIDCCDDNGRMCPSPRLDVVELSDARALLRANLALVSHVIGQIHSPVSSVDASKVYKDASLDFVMLDAGHEYADLRSDIDAWWPKVKPGGILATHDFCHYFPGLMRAWLESFPRFNVWAGSEWPEDGDARPDARADLVNRSALKKDTDFMPVAWIRK